jgi:hypothetical protein
MAFAAPNPPAVGEKTQADMAVKVAAVQGNAEVRSAPDAQWMAMKAGDALPLGSQIRTGLRSSVTMNVGPNAEVTVKSLTIMMVSDLVADDANTLRTRLALKYGRLKFDVRHVGFKNDFQVATPTGVMAVKGTGGWVITFDGRPMIMGVDTNGFQAILQQFNNGDYSFLTGADQISGAFIDPNVFRDYLNTIASAGGVPSEMDAVYGRLELTNLPAEEILDIRSGNDSIRATEGGVEDHQNNDDSGGENQLGDAGYPE